MFKELYRKVDSKVEPDLKLINDTKVKMRNELRQSKILNVSFYKYATIAACFILVIGLCSVRIGTISSNVVQDMGSSSNSSINSSFDSEPQSSGVISESSNFSGVTQIDSYFYNSDLPQASGSTASVSENPIIKFFVNILQWFQELLF